MNDSAPPQPPPSRQEQAFVSGEALWSWWKSARAAAATHEVPPQELDWLLQALTDVDRLALRLESFRERASVSLSVPFADLQRLWQQRIQERIPVQYLATVAPWRQFVLKVSPAVLIPRPETEEIIDLATQATAASFLTAGNWVDLGTGSGAIAIGLAAAFPDAVIHAVDRSGEALAIARENACLNGFGDRIRFYQGSWFEPLTSLRGSLSGMVSNPPYIPSALVPQLQPEVARHEPHLALDGGEDGLTAVNHLIQTAPEYLRSGGIWLVELMAGQAEAVADRLQAQGSYTDIRIYPDLAGIDRFVLARRI